MVFERPAPFLLSVTLVVAPSPAPSSMTCPRSSCNLPYPICNIYCCINHLSLVHYSCSSCVVRFGVHVRRRLVRHPTIHRPFCIHPTIYALLAFFLSPFPFFVIEPQFTPENKFHIHLHSFVWHLRTTYIRHPLWDSLNRLFWRSPWWFQSRHRS